MQAIKRRWMFLGASVAGLAIVVGLTLYARITENSALKIKELTGQISVSEQLKNTSLSLVRERGFASVIDLRPDGEVAGQPSSAEMSAVAQREGMKFYYVPVPHGAIPDRAVSQLADALRNAPKPVLMYCRSGKRAARTWSLVEASRPDGMDGAAILTAVQKVGQSAEDLQPEIQRRIAARRPVQEPAP